MLPFMLRAAGPKYRPATSAGALPSTPPPYTPLLWYDNATMPTSFGVWVNSGTGGSTYDLGAYAGTVTVTTFPSTTVRAAYFNGGANLQFTSGTALTLHQTSTASPFFILGVAAFNSGSIFSFVGSQGLSTTLPNGIGVQNFPTGYEAYDNDGIPASHTYANPAGVPTQYGYYHNTSNQVFWYEARTPGAIYSTTGSYGAQLTVRGVTGMRSSSTNDSYLAELLVFNTNLNTSQVQEMRNWLGTKYSTVGRVNV